MDLSGECTSPLKHQLLTRALKGSTGSLGSATGPASFRRMCYWCSSQVDAACPGCGVFAFCARCKDQAATRHTEADCRLIRERVARVGAVKPPTWAQQRSSPALGLDAAILSEDDAQVVGLSLKAAWPCATPSFPETQTYDTTTDLNKLFVELCCKESWQLGMRNITNQSNDPERAVFVFYFTSVRRLQLVIEGLMSGARYNVVALGVAHDVVPGSPCAVDRQLWARAQAFETSGGAPLFLVCTEWDNHGTINICVTAHLFLERLSG